MFDRSEEQLLFESTTRRFLDEHITSSRLRELGRSDHGFESSFWKQGAELGWTSLLVSEEAGGGSISESGLLDLLLVAYQFGLHAAPGPLGPSNLCAAALNRWGSSEQQASLLPPLLSGDSIASWAPTEPGEVDLLGRIALAAHIDGDAIVLSGSKSPVEGGDANDWFLVPVCVEGACSHVLVPSDQPGLRIEPLRGLDITRRFCLLDFVEVRLPRSALVGEIGGGSAAVEWLLDVAVVIQLAEMVGVMQWAFDITLSWAFNRYSFGRPLASYQEIKHRFADLKTWLEASRAITGAAGRAISDGAPDRSHVVSAGKFYVGRHGSELLQDCVQLHGGIGVTSDHDLHLYLRRMATDVPILGSPAEHATRLASLLEGGADQRAEAMGGNQ